MWSQAEELMNVGKSFHQRGWSLGTSGNFSLVLDREPLRVLITASGRDKSRLKRDDFVVVDEAGCPVEVGTRPANRPSAEALLHVVAARWAGAGAVLHTHSVWATLLSDLYALQGGMVLEGYEMLKGLEGIGTHEARLWIEILENTQDIPALARQVEERMRAPRQIMKHGFLIRNHGLYAWGRNLEEAWRHVEIFEFLFEVLGRKKSLSYRAER